MEYLKNQWRVATTQEKIGFVSFGLIVILFITGILIRFIHGNTNVGQWTVFNSRERLTGEDDPDGFRLEYPSSWEANAYSGGGSHNMGELRALFNYPFYLFEIQQNLHVYWRRVDEDWTRYDARDWYIEDLPFGHAAVTNENIYQEIKIGKGNYLALTGTNLTTFDKRRVVVLVIGDEAFALDFYSERDDPEVDVIFERMLDSFEVYK
jgi:hypothetical protein